MKIEKINDNKIKIMFDSKELEENNITVHSFLSNSIESQKLFLAILDIANEDFGFDISNSLVSCETISFSNQNFVIIVTKTNDKISNNLYTNFQNNSKETSSLNKFSFNFIGDDLLKSKISTNIIQDMLLYSFNNINDVFAFSDYLNNTIKTENISSFFYKYNNCFFIKINLENLDFEFKNTLISILSEYKENLVLSPLAIAKFEEFSTVLINNNALKIL